MLSMLTNHSQPHEFWNLKVECNQQAGYWDANDTCVCLPCANDPPACFIDCKNGGSPNSQLDPNNWKPCVCPTYYSGQCCSEKKCAEGFLKDGTCACDNGYEGMHCQVPKCKNGGTFDGLKHKCRCIGNWAGVICTRKACRNGGIWDASGNQCNCSESNGYTGEICQNLVCKHGHLDAGDSMHQDCICSTFYVGDNCNQFNTAALFGLFGATICVILVLVCFCRITKRFTHSPRVRMPPSNAVESINNYEACNVPLNPPSVTILSSSPNNLKFIPPEPSFVASNRPPPSYNEAIVAL